MMPLHLEVIEWLFFGYFTAIYLCYAERVRRPEDS